MGPVELVAQVWEILVGVIAVVAWLIRLESKVMYLEKELKNHKESSAEKDKALWTKLESIQTTLNQVLQAIGKLEGRVEK